MCTFVPKKTIINDMLTRYIFRALCALLVGFLLVSNPAEMTIVLVQVIGGLFIISGVLAFIGYFNTRRQLRKVSRLAAEQGTVVDDGAPLLPMFPVVGLGSVLLGVMLVVWPTLFVSILMYVLGGLLALIGISQISALTRYRQIVSTSWTAYILPLAIIAAGIFVIAKPMEAASIPFTILGIAYIAYGVSEFFIGMRRYRIHKALAAEQQRLDQEQAVEAMKQDAEEAEVVEVADE